MSKKSVFWISRDAVIASTQRTAEGKLEIRAYYTPRDEQESDFLRQHLRNIQFTERSTLARIGIEVLLKEPPRFKRGNLMLVAEAFVVDPRFPTFDCLPLVLQPGVPVGRFFYAPPSRKLSSEQVTEGLKNNEFKLPNSISIDHEGRVHFTPHRVQYYLPETMSVVDLQRLAKGHAPRAFLNKIQIYKAVDAVTIPPHSGILTSCSMYLQRHYVLLKRDSQNFGIHTGAVLLDPAKTFGPNIMLEIYNTSDQLVVNPQVSVELYEAPEMDDPELQLLSKKRQTRLADIVEVYNAIDTAPVPTGGGHSKPKTHFSLKGQNALTENPSLTLPMDGGLISAVKARLAEEETTSQTVIDAVSHKRTGDNALVLTYFPSLFEHIEILSRFQRQRFEHIVFRRASQENAFFLNADAHARLETYEQLGIQVHWYNDMLNDLYRYSYKKGHGFFIREEQAKQFDISTIFAMYGSAVDLSSSEAAGVRGLINSLIEFFGNSIGFLTGGGGGVMGTATEAARERGCLAGACFLELEAQPPEVGVDFFNTFRETSRHNRQKWFEIADFCIFNLGGVGTLEEIGIEMCNLKLGLRPRVPYIFYNARYWRHLQKQLDSMINAGRAPKWIRDYILFTENPREVIDFYRKTLQVM